MAAAATDLVRKKKSNFSTTLSSSIDDSTSTIAIASKSGLPTDTGVTLTIDRVDANGNSTPSTMERVTGIVNGSSNQLDDCVRGVEGTAQSHSAGAIVEDIWEAATWNDMSTAFLVNHAQDGKLKVGAEIHDAAQSFQYQLSAGVLSADRVVFLPALLSADTFVFAKHTQTLQNKTHSGDFALANSADNITSGGSDPWRTISLMAGFIKPTTSDGCANSEQIETSTNSANYDVLAFDKTSQERAYCLIPMPASYDGGVIQFRTIWTASGGSASETFELEMGGRALADDDAIDQAMGTFVGVSDALIASSDIHISGWSSNVTLAGSPSGGQLVLLEFRRDVANDNLDADARLIAVQVRYKQGTYTD